MGFGEAFINIVLTNQWVLQFPLVYDKTLDRLLPNPNLGKWWKMLRWRIGNIFICCVWLYSIFHLFFMKRNKKNKDSSGKAFKEEMLVYVFTISITTQAVLTWEAVSRNPTWFAYVEGQILRAYDVCYRGFPNAQRKPDTYEIASYFLAGGFICFPLVATVLPIIRSYDPINQMFLTFVPIHVEPRIRFGIVIVLYLLSVTFGALSCLNLVLLTASHCFIATRLAQRNIEISMSYLNHCPSIRYSNTSKGQITQNVYRITSVELRNLRRVFQKRRQYYLEVKLITATVNRNLDYYVPGMVGVGMALCSFCYFGVLEFHNRLPKVMIAGMVFIALFINTLTINLINFSSHPLTLSELFVHFWSRVNNIGQMERKQIKALLPVFFGMGQYFPIKKSTALDIMDTILECTINALMS